MSMLSRQIDKLREKAQLFEGYNNGEISRMLRDAADTIESLREKEKATEAWNTRAEMSQEDIAILLDELGVSERTCHKVVAITDDGKYQYSLCSECNCHLEQEDNYCPNCGAKVVNKCLTLS